MRIHVDDRPPELVRDGSVSAFVGALIDPSLTVLTLLGVLAAHRVTLGSHGLVLLFVAALLSYPGRLCFRHCSTGLIVKILMNWTLTFGVLLALGFVSDTLWRFDAAVLVAGGVCVPLVLILAHSVSPSFAPFLRSLHAPRKAIIVGTSEVGIRLAALIESGEAGGQRISGYFDDRCPERLYESVSRQITGRIEDVADYVNRHAVNVIYIALPMASNPRIRKLLEQLKDTTASVHFVPDIFIPDLIQGRVGAVAGVPTVAVCESPFDGVTGVLKRLMDVTLVVAALPLVLPLMGVITCVVRLTSPGPAIFRQRRYGLDGQQIVVWKFRTMSVREDGETTYRQVTEGDSRVTSVGKILRKTSLDELPQLFNVLEGSMSLVGPRPHAIAVNEQYRKLIPGYMVRHKVKPGITGWAQVNGFRGGDDLDSMQMRVQYDLDYLRGWSPALDWRIVWKTVVMLVRGDAKAF